MKKKKKNHLPIADFRGEIVEAVRTRPVTIITAETGAGKSTQVPQYLLDDLGSDLVVTQPRRLAARTVAQRVAEERGADLGRTIGFRTAVDRQDSPATRCLFCTDGLALVRELMGQNRGILVLDEVHEWNENMEVLVAWAKCQIESGADFKVVLMSATLEAEKLAAFYNGAPVIAVPGRTFPVEERRPSSRLIEDVIGLVREGRNVLVFQPGKQEISETCQALAQMQVSAEILPLHGQLTPEEQAQCFKHYGRPKVVVSTNVAQTSVTIDDIDAVVDSGMERRIELVDGVEGLYLKPISLADATQRKGRAGRTKAGIYIDHCPSASRPEFPRAEILRKRLDQTVLRLAIAGFDMEELAFFHQPNKSDISDARRTLVGLGCMTADGSVTRIGRLVNRLPVSVQYARMLVEADRLGVVDDVITVAAIMEMSGITVPPPSRNRPDRPDWRRMVPDEEESDVMGQLSVWRQAETMTKDEMHERGISIRSYFRAKEIRRHLAQAVKRFFKFGSSHRREDILKAVCAGMVDHLYHGEYGEYTNGEEVRRELGTASCVRGARWLVGKPFDLQIKTRRGMITLKLIELASKVDPMWLTEIAPQLVSERTGLEPHYDPKKDQVVSTTQVFFNGQLVRQKKVPDPEHPEAAAIFARWLSYHGHLPEWLAESDQGREIQSILTANEKRQRRAWKMNVRAGKVLFKKYTPSEMFELFQAALRGARRVAEIPRPQALALPALDEEQIASILKDNPDTIKLLGKELSVTYGDGYGHSLTYPKVNVEVDLDDKSWQDWPEEILLPGGRKVQLVATIRTNGESFQGADILQLKEEIRRSLNFFQLKNWIRSDKSPKLETPRDVLRSDFPPPITSAIFGRCVLTGKELKAFGTFRYDVWSRNWQSMWYLKEADAFEVHADSSMRIAAMRAKLEQERALEEAQKGAASARDKLRDLCSQEEYYEIDRELKREIGHWQQSYLPRSLKDLKQDKANTEALYAKVEAKLGEIRRRQISRVDIKEQLDELQEIHGWPAAHIITRDNGEVAVNCGKASKMGRYEVSPTLGERQCGPESLDEEGRLSVWQPIPTGQKVTIRDFSSSGNLKYEVTFWVPKDQLKSGVWAVIEDGETFYPVIYWNGREIIPDSIETVQAASMTNASDSQREADLVKVDLSKLFGGHVKIR